MRQRCACWRCAWLPFLPVCIALTRAPQHIWHLRAAAQPPALYLDMIQQLPLTHLLPSFRRGCRAVRWVRQHRREPGMRACARGRGVGGHGGQCLLGQVPGSGGAVPAVV